MLLFINACVRDDSRTEELARYLLSGTNDIVQEIRLCEQTFPAADQSFLDKRNELISKECFSDPLFTAANQFASAVTVVIAAPYWDLSFPAALKQYFEQINVIGITFTYSCEGMPVGLCCARKLYYITTAGGRIVSEEYGYGYVKALAGYFYKIPEIYQIKAEGLDIYGADICKLMDQAKRSIDDLLK